MPPTGPTWSAGSGREEANFAGGLFGGGGAHGDGETGDEEEADSDFVVDGGGPAEDAGEGDFAGERFDGGRADLIAQCETAGEDAGGGGGRAVGASPENRKSRTVAAYGDDKAIRNKNAIIWQAYVHALLRGASSLLSDGCISEVVAAKSRQNLVLR